MSKNKLRAKREQAYMDKKVDEHIAKVTEEGRQAALAGKTTFACPAKYILSLERGIWLKGFLSVEPKKVKKTRTKKGAVLAVGTV